MDLRAAVAEAGGVGAAGVVDIDRGSAAQAPSSNEERIIKRVDATIVASQRTQARARCPRVSRYLVAMNSASETPVPNSTTPASTESARGILCPYCALVQAPATECSGCGGCFDAWSLKATQDDMGAWYVRDSKRPHFVGFSHEALVAAIRAGEFSMNTLMRGPTTRQFWSTARRTPGIAHYFGRCFACQAPVQESAPQCKSCGAEPTAVADRNFLGLPAVERIAPPTDAKPDFSAFIDDSGLLIALVAPVLQSVAASKPPRLPSQIVPNGATVVVRSDAAPVPAPPFVPLQDSTHRSALTPLHHGLAARAKKLERTNRLLLGVATISFVAAVGAVLVSFGQAEGHRREVELKVSEAVRSVRSEFERKPVVVTPPRAELPPMPEPIGSNAPPKMNTP
ncbi:MAG: hypothetical protein DWH74_02610 [Planctomycetota bacterium]|nr:MAG: hypothetical protein DWH74_02610 [Planctomycetota bacterium]